MFTWSLFRLYALHVSYAIVHVLRSLKPSHQLLKLIDIYGMELDLTVLLFFFVHAVFFFTFSFVSSIFGMLGIMFGLAIWVGVFMGKLRSVQ